MSYKNNFKYDKYVCNFCGKHITKSNLESNGDRMWECLDCIKEYNAAFITRRNHRRVSLVAIIIAASDKDLHGMLMDFDRNETFIIWGNDEKKKTLLKYIVPNVTPQNFPNKLKTFLVFS